MNSGACFDTDFRSISIESYGVLSDTPPPPPPERYESDCDDRQIQRNVFNDHPSIDCSELVEPASIPYEENSLSDAVDNDDDDLQMFMFDYSRDEHMLWNENDFNATGEIQLDRGMSGIGSTRAYAVYKVDPFIKKDNPLLRSKVDNNWNSKRIDPPSRNDANSITQQFFVILEVFTLRCAFDHLRRAKNNDEEAVRALKKYSDISRSSSLRFERKRSKTLPYNASHINERMEHNLDQRRDQVFSVHRKVMEKVLRSWRAITVTASKLRQKYYLMMIVNRWKLYTDDCIDLRRKRDVALLHWATIRCKKSFTVLKLHAKQSKEEKRPAIALQNKVRRVGPSYERDSSLRFVKPSISDSNSKVDPSISKIFPKVLPDHRFSLARDWFDNIRSPLIQAGSVSTSTSTMRQSYPSMLRDFHAQQAQTLMSPMFESTKCYSVGKPSTFFSSSVSNDRLASVLTGSRKRFARRPRHFLGLTHHASCFGEAGSSLRIMKDHYQERFLTASVLDEMISIIEHRYFQSLVKT